MDIKTKRIIINSVFVTLYITLFILGLKFELFEIMSHFLCLSYLIFIFYKISKRIKKDRLSKLKAQIKEELVQELKEQS